MARLVGSRPTKISKTPSISQTSKLLKTASPATTSSKWVQPSSSQANRMTCLPRRIKRATCLICQTIPREARRRIAIRPRLTRRRRRIWTRQQQQRARSSLFQWAVSRDKGSYRWSQARQRHCWRSTPQVCRRSIRCKMGVPNKATSMSSMPSTPRFALLISIWLVYSTNRRRTS